MERRKGGRRGERERKRKNWVGERDECSVYSVWRWMVDGESEETAGWKPRRLAHLGVTDLRNNCCACAVGLIFIIVLLKLINQYF
jgi:hypothetical protein